MNTAQLLLTDIRLDSAIQARVSINDAVVAEYADALTEGATLPPVTVYFDGTAYYLADGHHRFHAHRRVGYIKIDATVVVGSRRDAELFSTGANADHGLRRSDADKEKAVRKLLTDAEWSTMSDRAIARQCRVSPNFVGKQKAILTAHEDSEKSAERTYITKYGTVATMATGNIGKGKAGKPKATGAEPAATEEAAAAAPAAAAPTPAPAPRPAAAQAPAANEPESADPSDEELQAAVSEHNDRLDALEALLEADDKLQALLDENVKLRERNRILAARVLGLTNECAQAIRLAKSWRTKFERSGRAA